jgi:hypothetical protein
MRGDLAALAAVMVGVEHEATRIDLFQEHDPCGRPAVCVDGAQRHGIGLGDVRGSRRGEPARELLERIGGDVALVERRALVFGAKGCEIERVGHDVEDEEQASAVILRHANARRLAALGRTRAYAARNTPCAMVPFPCRKRLPPL